MEGNFLPDWAEQALGALIVLLIVIDVFLTVLYARAGIGTVSNLVVKLTWLFFRAVSKPFGSYRGTVLSLCGPMILVLLITVWTFALTLGAALIIHPELGKSVQVSSGETPTDFITALYAGGSSLSVVGASDFTPKTAEFQLFYILNSLIGMSIVSLTLMYLMQVYNALQRRNGLALKLYLATGETGDAAELLAGLGPEGKFDGGYSNLADMAMDMAQVKESHHFYAVLFFFRFNESYYSMTQTSLTSLDTVSLIKSALSDERYAWLKESLSTTQLWRASMMMLKTSANTFLSGEMPDEQKQPDEQTLESWRRRYFAALKRLRQANIETIADEQAGFEIYVSLRSKWEDYITSLAPQMAYGMEEVDSAGSNPESALERRDFRARQHSVG
jgi:hypothetical protein